MKPKSQSQKSQRPLITFIIIAIVLIAGVAALVLSRNSNSKMNGAASTGSSTANAVATDKVVIENYAFSPMVITVKVGTTVTWTNKDAVNHSVTVDSGSMPSSPLFGRDQPYSYTFTKTGTVTYHCAPHPYMHGTVIVTN
jgi:amicyanin